MRDVRVWWPPQKSLAKVKLRCHVLERSFWQGSLGRLQRRGRIGAGTRAGAAGKALIQYG